MGVKLVSDIMGRTCAEVGLIGENCIMRSLIT
jgi:hypothetical protein